VFSAIVIEKNQQIVIFWSKKISGKRWVAVISAKKPQAPTPQAPIRNRQTRKVANAKGLSRNTNFT